MFWNALYVVAWYNQCIAFVCILFLSVRGTVEPRYNEVLGTMKITLLYQVSHIRVKTQRNIKSWDQQNYLVILKRVCYIRPLYNEVPLYQNKIFILVMSVCFQSWCEIMGRPTWLLACMHQGCESSDFNLISDFFAPSQNPIFRLWMQFECIGKHIFSSISDYFRLRWRKKCCTEHINKKVIQIQRVIVLKVIT